MRFNFYVLAKRPPSFLLFFCFLICLTLSSYSLISRKALTAPNHTVPLPGRSVLSTPDDPRLPPGFRRLPVASTDPIRFSLRVNRQTVKLNEPVELTITAELLNISPTLLFSLPGANSYRLKMLLPPGFEQTGGDFTDYVSGELSYPSRSVITYRLTGRFTSVTAGSSFRLLRSHGQADNQSLFVEKATLRLRSLPGEGRLATETVATTTPTLFVVTEQTPSGARSGSDTYQGFLDVATCEVVSGWAVDPGNTRKSVQIDIFINGKKATTVTANQERPDVASSLQVKDFDRYGYYWPIPAEYKTNKTLAIAVKVAETDHELVHSPRTTEVCAGPDKPEPPKPEPPKPDKPDSNNPPANAKYYGHLDVATCEAVSGWAINSSNPRSSVQVDIYIDNKKVVTLPANQERPDVSNAIGVKDFNRYGYYWPIPAEYKKNAKLAIAVRPYSTSQDLLSSPRTTEVCTGSDKPEPPKPEPPKPEPPKPDKPDPGDPPANANYLGYVDVATCEVVSGWAVDLNNLRKSVQVDIYINNQKVTTVTANQERSDVANDRQARDFNRFGYYWRIPDEYKKNQALTIAVKPISTNRDLTRSPRTTEVCAGPDKPDNCAFAISTAPLSATCASSVTLNATCTGANCDSVTYVWSGNGIDRTGQSVQISAPSTNGQYTYTVTATRRNCAPKTATLVLTVSGCNPPPPPPPSDNCAFVVSTAPLSATCASSVTLNATCTGANCDSVTYVWSGNGIDRTGQSVQISAPSTNGQYTYTVTATRRNCAPKTATLVLTVSGCNPPPPPPQPGEYPILDSEPPADKRPVLQNDRIRLAIDLGVGGVIREVTDRQVGENMINCMIKGDGKRDPGRDDQISLYALPADNSGWTQNGKPVYRDIGYNPVQGGDIVGNFSPVLGYGRTDNMLYCKTRGLHWGIDNEMGDYTVEQWIRLEGNIVRRHIRIIGSRADQTKYPESRQQEIPCTYTNSAYYQYYVVQGDPYTNAGLVNVNTIPNIGGSGQMLSQHPGHGETGPHNVDASEPWIMAVRPNTNRGIALHTPFSHEFKAAQFGQLGYGPAESSDAGYIANGMTMILDPNGVYEFDINMVVGTREEMRSTLNTLPRSETKPHYVFANNPIRHGFYYRKGYDQGFPMGNELVITPTDRRFRLLSPRKGYRASESRVIYVRFRAITTETRMVFDWRKVGQTELEAEQANQAITFNIRGDNQYQTIAIPVGNHPLWNGTINDFSIRFANPTETPVSGQQLGVKWISTENLGDN